jgi:hypothetical protein
MIKISMFGFLTRIKAEFNLGFFADGSRCVTNEDLLYISQIATETEAVGFIQGAMSLR